MKKPNKMKHTLGYDPEVMIKSGATGKVVSAIPVLKCNKKAPIELGEGILFYADNVLAESASPPALSVQEALDRLGKSLKRMQAHLGDAFHLLAQTSHVYDAAELADPVAWEIGCSPNFCAYTGAVNEPKPFPSALRTGSFHIHVGNREWKTADPTAPLMNPVSKMKAIKVLDIILGCSSVVFDKDPTSLARREVYGKAGEFRPTPYGIEYRVMGNYALRSPHTAHLVFDLVNHAMNFMFDGDADALLAKVNPAIVRESINTANRTMALGVLVMAELPAKLLDRVQTQRDADMHKAWGMA